MKHSLFFIILTIFLLFGSTVHANIDGRINEMLNDGQQVSFYKDHNLGRSVIAIGYGNNANPNIAIDMAKQQAMKYMAAFLKGETISAIEVAKQKYIGDYAEESYYQQMKTSVNASLRAAYFYKSGNHEYGKYAVVIIAEKSKAEADFFTSKSNPNIIEAKGFASINEGISKARNYALNQALRNAVEQYGGVQIAAKTSIENSDKYRAKLASVSKGHVKKYEIKNEYQKGNNFVVVIIAEISEEDPDVDTSIEAIKESMGRPAFYLNVEDLRIIELVRNILSKHDFDITPDKLRAKYLLTAEVKKYEYDVSMSKQMKGIQTTINIKIVDKYSGEDFINISNTPENSVEISASQEIRERNSYNYAMEELGDRLIKELNRKFGILHLSVDTFRI